MVSPTCKKMVLINFAITAVILVVALFFFTQPEQQFDFAKGLIFASVFSALKTVLLERNLRKAVNMSSDAATNYSRLHYFLRYILTGVMLFVAAKISPVCLFGAAAGLIPIQFAAYFVNLFLKKDEKV